ncbi:MAG: hypothetical protein WA667_12685 [Candidatus Nitrosopolaris sp.]
MPRQFQEKLVNFMESGHIKVDQMRKNMISKSMERRYLQLAMKSQGYQDPCNLDFDVYICHHIQKSNF